MRETREERVRQLMIDALRDLNKPRAIDGIFSANRSPAEIVDALRPVWHELLLAAERALTPDEAARRVVQACGCGQEGGCERIYSQEWPPAEWDIGCRRFVRAVRGEA